MVVPPQRRAMCALARRVVRLLAWLIGATLMCALLAYWMLKTWAV